MEQGAETGLRRSPFWAFVLSLVIVAQGALALRLFDQGPTPTRLMNDSPVLDGKHPLHAYHGLLGHRVWHASQGHTCYDPSFQAGYLKTPIFDSGSRPAELFYLIGGPTPASYKMGLWACCLLAPMALALAARGANLPPSASCLAAILACALWWSPPARELLLAGDIDLLVGGAISAMYLAWLARYSRSPGPLAWMTLAFTAVALWYIHPVLAAITTSIALLYHCWTFRGMGLAWHAGLFLANAVGVGVNFPWLKSWAMHAWMYVPYSGADAPPVRWPDGVDEWQAFLPSDPGDLTMCGIGLLGLFALGKRSGASAGLFVAGTVCFAALGGLGKLWPPAAELGACRVLAVAVWCMIIPCTAAMSAMAGGVSASAGFRPLGIIWLAVGLTGLTYGLDLPRRLTVPSLTIGLSPEREDVVRALRERTTPDGRVLWESRADDGGWTAFLPEWTQRSYLGGLSQEAPIEHLAIRLHEGRLLQRPVAEWPDDDLERFFDRYNVTRVACRSPESIARFRKLPGASSLGPLKPDGELFAIDRSPKMLLKGTGQVIQLDWKRIALANLEPDENGTVVISLHHHPGWRVTPDYVVVERDVGPTEPLPMIRLRLPGPVSRVTMTWRGE